MTDTLERPNADIASRPRRRGARRWRSVLVLVLFVVVGFVATGVLPVREYLERNNDVLAAQAELDQLRAENQTLGEDIDALYTEQEIERVAREQYGLVREGETGYFVVTPEGDEVSSVPDDSVLPEPAVPASRSFLQRIWDFVTGNDLNTDG